MRFEINPVIGRNVRSCRVLVPDGTEFPDENWHRKISDEMNYRGGGYVLSRIKAEVPKGVKVTFELQPGADMTRWVGRLFGGKVPIHICTREMARQAGKSGWAGVVKDGLARGMKWIGLPEEEVEPTLERLNSPDSKIQH